MPLSHPFALMLRTLVVSLFLLLLAPAGFSAPKPLPPLTPEELALRALVQPLREHGTQTPDATVQAIHDWLDVRHQAGKGRAAEAELTRTLKRMHDDTTRDLLRAAEWVHRLQVQRSKLYDGLTKEKAGLERTLKDYQESPPVPELKELLPGFAGISDAFLHTAGDETVAATSSVTEADALAVDIDDATWASAADADMDEARLLNRLTLDLTMLGHLLHECDNEFEAERARHRIALAALGAVVKDYHETRQPNRR